MKLYSPSAFDLVAALFLLAGLMHGRKRGMSEEVLDLVKWVLAVFIGAKFYAPASTFIANVTHIQRLFSNIAAYSLIILVVVIVVGIIKSATGEKLLGKDIFGSLEYYLGMVSGLIRGACILVVCLNFLSSRSISDAELAVQIKQDKEVYGDTFFPRWGKVQRMVFNESKAGVWITRKLGFLLIEPTPYVDIMTKRDGFSGKVEREVNEVIDHKK